MILYWFSEWNTGTWYTIEYNKTKLKVVEWIAKEIEKDDAEDMLGFVYFN